MSAGWSVAIVLAIGTYVMKAAGPLVVGRRSMPRLLERLAQLAPAGLLAALVIVSAFKRDGSAALSLDARAVGLAAACVALWRRQGFIVVVVIAAIATAIARRAGMA